MTIALVREVSSRFNECEITHIEREPIDVQIARAQHQEYTRTLRELGCQIVELPEEPVLPDSVFVEDAAFILPEVAVITRPGADSRKPETESIAQALSQYLPLVHISEPATLDGGDVLVLDRNIYVGLSTRSNDAAIGQITRLLNDHEYRVIGVEMHDCLHLKSAVTSVDSHTLLLNKNWVDTHHFVAFDWIEVDVAEPFAANCLPINGEIIFPSSFPKTAVKLQARGHKIRTVAVDELAKAEGAVTCCSLILDQSNPPDLP